MNNNDTTILLIDDDEITLEMMKAALKGAGYNAVTTSDPSKALEMAIHLKPDFVVIDIVMPSMSGEELCREFKLNPLTKQMPIFFMSASSDIDHAIASLHLGCVDYIKKPITTSDLLNVILKHDVMNKITDAWEPARRELQRVIDKYERKHRAHEVQRNSTAVNNP